jgi:hypothetical protein
MLEKEQKEGMLEKSRNSEDNSAVPVDLTKQPQSYVDKMGLFEKNPLLNCFANQKELKLSRDNLRTFHKLVREADTLFDETNNDHLRVLSEVHRLTFGVLVRTAEQVLDDPQWKTYGFQTSRPATDFRGGGLLSLKTLRHIGEKEPGLATDALAFMQTSESYLHACVVITVVFQLKNFFHFGLFSTYNESYDLEKACSRRCLKFFLDLNSNSALDGHLSLFLGLATAAVRRMLGFWKKSIELDPRLTIMDFKQAETIVMTAAKSVIEVEAEKKRVPSYTGEQLVEQILCAKISDKVIPLVFK